MSQPTTTPIKAFRQLVRRYSREALGVVAVAASGGLPLLVPAGRRYVGGYMRCARTRRLVKAGLSGVRMSNNLGQVPRVWSVKATPVGERVQLRTRPGHSAELLQLRMEELRAACKARTVRIERDPGASHRIIVDVVRKDPLASTPEVPWADQSAPVLSLWEPVHLGLTEMGEHRRLSLVERGLLIGGLAGTGKSSLLNLITSHAAKSAAELYLIDPNGVQFGPWRDRATAYAGHDPDEALDVLDMVRAEIARRLALLETLPGVVRKVTRQIAEDHGLHPLLLGVDELAYHTSVVGTPQQQQRFAISARDVVSRGRAAGVIPVMATQRPTQDVVPRSLSDLFGLRMAFRTANAANSDVVLGEGLAARGYNAADIELESRGVGLLLAEGARPEKVKVTWVPDELIADLSITTVPMKPRNAATVRAA